MSQRHLARGAEMPPLRPGVLRLYSMKYCPFAQRARLVLEHKNIAYEELNVNLKKKPDWLLARNPLGLVPIAEQDGRVLYESLIVCDWLDEAYPGPRLTLEEPFARARQRLLVQGFDKVISAYYAVFRAKSDEEKAPLREKYYSELDKFEEQLSSDFFGGDNVSMTDYMIWPWFERMPATNMMPLQDRTPRLRSWMERMEKQGAVAKLRITDDEHRKIVSEYYAKGEDFDYDQFLEE